MTVGGVLGEAWELYKRFLGRFFLTALVLFAVLDLLSALADQAASDGWTSGLFWGLVAAIVSIVGYSWVQAALVETVHDVRDGRADRTIGETYRAVQPQLGAVILGGILAAIGITIGFILLIVPGLFLLTIWSMLIPVIVLERRSTGEAFTRSREVVGYWLRTRAGTRPLAIHAAWRTDAETAAEVVLATCRARTPEPLRKARRQAREARAGDSAA